MVERCMDCDPDILRGVLLSTVLTQGSFWMRSGPICGKSVPSMAVGDEMYALSTCVCKLKSFLSHSWHASGWVKAAAMLIYYNGTPAAIGGLVCSVFGAGLTAVGVLPVWN